jgi:hypothetical protein
LLAARRRLLERGRLVAVALEGAWRDPPPPLALTAGDLEEAGPLLLATGVAGLAWRRLPASSPEPGRSMADTLRDAFRAHALEGAVHAHQLAAVAAVLAAARIPFLVGKGWAVARLYPEPGTRAYGDLDLYVGARQHGAALQALAAPGAPRAPVDLHRGFGDLDDLDEATLFERSQAVPLGTGTVRVFGPEDHLRLLSLHALRHGLSRPGWLCDLALVLESRPPGFDWERLLSGRRRRADAVACALALAHELLGAHVHGTPLERRRAPGWMVHATLRQWGGGSGWREPIGSFRRRPRGLLRELGRHWPNPIEATVGLGAPFAGVPRFPCQLAFAAIRAARFARARRRVES